MGKKKTVILTTLILLSCNGYAQTEVTLNPVVVTGTGTYHKAENAPVAVRVISKKELQDANVTNLQDALAKLTPNLTTHTSGMGTFVNFNGVSDDYLIILENGRRISGDDRWNRISMDNIKRIEIMPSAASVLYGSDAMAGVINIITDDNATAEPSIHASSSTKYMRKGRLDEDINLDITQGKFSSHTSFNHRQADNWQVNKYQEFEEGDNKVAKLTGRPMSQGFRSENLNQKFTWRFNDQWDVYAKGNYYNHNTLRDHNAQYFTQKKTTKNGTTAYTYTPKQAYTYDMHHESYNIGAGARWTPSRNVHIYLDLYTDNYKSDYDYWQTTEEEAYSETRKKTHYYNETLKGIFRLNSWNKIIGGIEMEQNVLKSASDNIEKESTNTYNIFAQDELSICKMLDAVVGLRYTYNDNFDSHLTPNAALFFHTGGVRLRVSYAGGYRTPTLSQMYATDQAKTSSRYTLSNQNLKPETNHFWNSNAEYSNKWMSVSVSAYINKIKDMINYRTMTNSEIDADATLRNLRDNDGWMTIRQRDNIDNATIKGISANVKFLLPYGFTVGGGYTYTDSKAETKTLNAKTQEYEITESPVDKCVHNVANVMASWSHTWGRYTLNASVNGHIQGERYSSTYGYAPKFQIWDLHTKHTIKTQSPKTKNQNLIIEPGIGIENIFNKRDTSYWNSNFSTINPGRSLYVSFALKY